MSLTEYAAALTLTGPAYMQANPDGTLTLTPVSPSDHTATAPQPAPPAYILEQQEDDGADACGCTPPLPSSTEHGPAYLQGRAISRHLANLGVAPDRRRVAIDPDHQAVAVRVETRHGLYALLIPAPGRRYPVLHHGQRITTLDARRLPGTSDQLIGTLYAATLRERGDL